MKIKKINKILEVGVHILTIPSSDILTLEEVFPKEISGSSIEKLNVNGTLKDI